MLKPSTGPDRVRAGALVVLRSPTPADGSAMWALAGDAGLDVNSPYAYVMAGEYHADTSVVAVDDDVLVGFVLGFPIVASPGAVFVWQIAVDDGWRGRGLASRLLDALVERTEACLIEATVTPSNNASAALFRSLASRRGTTAVEGPGFGDDVFPAGHEEERLFRIPTVPATSKRPGEESPSAGFRTDRIRGARLLPIVADRLRPR